MSWSDWTSSSAFADRELEHYWNAFSAPSVSVRMNRPFALAIALSMAAPPRLVAQSAQSTQAAAVPSSADTSLRRLSIDSTRVQPAHFLYRLSLTRDSVATALGDQRFTISTLDYAGTPGFLLARDGQQGVATLSDTLVIRRGDLRPLHWISSHGLARVAAEFTRDSIFGGISSPLGKQNVVLPNHANLLVNTMAVDLMLTAVPLTSTWRDSATMLLVDAGGSVITPATLSVDGEEHVSAPAGEYDCWIVSVETERGSERLWVTKQGQIVVRAEQILPELGGVTLTRLLVQSDSPVLPAVSVRSPQ